MKYIKYIFSFIFFYSSITLGQDTIIKQFFYPGGVLSSQGPWVNNKPVGYWKSYYPTGVLKSEGNRLNSKLDSVWTFYDEKGYETEKINYKYGLKNGYHTSFFPVDSINSVEPVIKSKELFLNGKREGWSYYYYPSGKLYEKFYFENGIKEGESFRFAEEDGRLILKLVYRDGILIESDVLNRYNTQEKKVGYWKTFYDNGKVKKEEYYKNGKLEGLVKEFKPSGELNIALRYDNDILVEEVTESSIQRNLQRNYFDNGNIKSEGFYVDSIPVGIHNFYDIDGNVLQTIIYNDQGNKLSEGILDKEGLKQGIWKNYYFSGKLKSTGKFISNKKEGQWDYYFENGKVEQKGKYKNDLLNGQWIWYYNNGDIWREESFVNGKNEGIFVEYDQSGNVIQEGEYFDGYKEGIWTHKVGDHIEKGEYISGLRNNVWKYFYIEGELHFEGNYIQGAPNGKHLIFYQNGELKEERIYVMGYKEKTWKKYYPDGELYMTVTYKDGKEFKINGYSIN